MMKAAVMVRAGKPAEALVYQDFAAPQRKPEDLLVEVAAAAVNPIDWKARKGLIPFTKTPKILGGDVAGVVLEAPPGSKFSKGDRVFGVTGQQAGGRYGTYAELVAAPASCFTAIPQGVSFQEAAAVPLAAMTAWQAMAPSMPLAGKRVLVHGGSGGVGGFGIQIAKAQGAWVATTCSGRNADFVTKQLGADVAIDYTKGPFEVVGAEACKEPFDVVLDPMGGDYQARSYKLLKKTGHYASVFNTGYIDKYGTLRGALFTFTDIGRYSLLSRLGRGPRFTNTLLDCTASKGLDQIADLMAQGKLKAHIDKVLPLSETAAAHEYGETGRTRGKVVLAVKDL